MTRDGFSDANPPVAVVCECGAAGCFSVVRLLTRVRISTRAHRLGRAR
jgi:hypothetical protein